VTDVPSEEEVDRERRPSRDDKRDKAEWARRPLHV